MTIDVPAAPLRQVRARFDRTTVTVYQAYPSQIADAAMAAGTFVAPFKHGRMTWIKPSFLWMMYRSGWATKPGQERVLSIRLSRIGFEQALADSCLSHFDSTLYASQEDWLARKESSPVRVQWDPERSVGLDPLPWRTIQVGLSGNAVQRYVSDWIVDLDDVSEQVRSLRDEGFDWSAGLPRETPYPLPPDIARTIGATEG